MRTYKRHLYAGVGFVLLALVACAVVLLVRPGAGSDPIPAAGGASSAIPAIGSIPYYLQNDPAWAGRTLGESNETLGNAGCTVCCLAMGLSALGFSMDPGQVCSDLNEVRGFTESGQVIWSAVAEVTDGAVRMGLPAPDYETIDSELTEGRPVVAKIMLSGSVPHWVLIVAKAGEEYLVMDPLDQDKNLGRLSERSSAIEAIRVFDGTSRL